MQARVRKFLAGLAGIGSAMLLVSCVEAIGHAVYPPPPGLDFKNMDAMRAYAASLPLGAMLFVLAGWTIGSFGGSFIGAKLAREQAMRYAAIVGAVMLLATAANLLMIPNPWWFSAAGILGVAGGAFLAGKLAGG